VKPQRIPPPAENMIESMRDIGYSFNTAIADLIDNSIAAKASRIDIYCTLDKEGKPEVALIDDGVGMDLETLRAAMAPASRDPRGNVEKGDLGRFGLGLKTASFSQCRNLTVLSRPRTSDAEPSKISGYCWDLDFVRDQRDWLCQQLSIDDVRKLVVSKRSILNGELLGATAGTAVIWSEIDRMFDGADDDNVQRIFQSHVSELHKHVGLVFHRYLSKSRGKLSIHINNSLVDPIDPFLENHMATSPQATETLGRGKTKIVVTPYILPHPSKIKDPELKKLISADKGIANSQGFYVYRNERLTVWGTWFGLQKKDELSKLARIRVDINSDCDSEWGIAVDKATANPSNTVKRHLQTILNKSIEKAKRPITHKVKTGAHPHSLWKRVQQDGRLWYELDPKAPVVNIVRESLAPKDKKSLDHLLRLITDSMPITHIVQDYSGDEDYEPEREVDVAPYFAMIEIMYTLWPKEKPDFRSHLMSQDIFAMRPAIVDDWLAKKGLI
jgi:hypothetical protein